MIPPSIFGRSWWATVHNAVCGFDDNTDQDWRILARWLRDTANVLPCRICRKTFSRILLQYPPEKYMGEGPLRRRQWYRLVRNAVRKNEGKKSEKRKWKQGTRFGIYYKTKAGKKVYLKN